MIVVLGLACLFLNLAFGNAELLPQLFKGFYVWESKYWERRGIPGPPSRLFYGHWRQLLNVRSPGILQIKEWTKEYGKVFGIYEGLRKVLIVSDVEMLHEMFVTKFEQFYGRKHIPLMHDPKNDPRMHLFNSEGTRWKRLRNMISPSFSVSNLKKIYPTVEDSGRVMFELISEHANTNEGFNIHDYFKEFTLDVIFRISMGQKGSRQFQNPAMDLILQIFMWDLDFPPTYIISGIPVIGWIVREMFYYGKQWVKRPFNDLEKFIEKSVERRREQRERSEMTGGVDEPIDFIDLFLDAEDRNLRASSEDIDRRQIKVERKMNTDEIISQCTLFLLAGFDTTANSLAYVAYLLAKNPRVMRKVQAEVDEYCGVDNFDYDTLQKLRYTECVCKEALRMYPLASFGCARTCAVDTTLGGIPIEKGTLVQADSFGLHFDKDIWGEDAEEFRPERWQDGQRRPQLSWLGFGGGPRLCIGMRLAYLEEKTALAMILRKYDILKCPETEKELKLLGLFTFAPEKVTVQLRSRR